MLFFPVMLRSMTSFARSSLAGPEGRFSIEIQSVNRKFLEISCHLPREFSHYELQIRKWLTKEIVFGQVQVTIRAHFEGLTPFKVVPNLALAKQIHQAWQEIALALNVKTDFDLQLLADKNVILFEDDPSSAELYSSLLEKLVNDCLKQFVHVREVEGKALADDFTGRLDRLELLMKQVEQLSKDAPEKQRLRLQTRMKEIIPDTMENQERILREAALFAEKVDVQEEITRFYSHVSQFRKLLDGGPEGVGKTMDFMTQELGREINTLGSKTQELEVSKLIIELKTELSRIREQVQNVE